MAPPRTDPTPRRTAPPRPSHRAAPPSPSHRAAPPPPSRQAAPPPPSRRAAQPPTPVRGAIDIECGNLKVHVSATEKVGLPGFYDASQTISGEKHSVLCRVYALSVEDATKHLKFLREFKDPHMLKPDYVLPHGDQSVFVFSQSISCTLRGYFKNNPNHIFCTGSIKDRSFSRDFKEPTISVLWQLAGTISRSHKQEVWLGGGFSLEEMFVCLDEGLYQPRLLLLPCFHDNRARHGEEPLSKRLSENLKALDFYEFGSVIYHICDVLQIRRVQSYEIFDLIHKFMKREFTSIEQFLRHPALVNEDTKLIIVKESQEGIFKQDKHRYFEPNNAFPDLPRFVKEPWTVKFQWTLNSLGSQVRDAYIKAIEPNNKFNIRLFSTNVTKHLDSHQGLKNNFGDGASFIRFLTGSYYPTYYIDLINDVGKYSNPVAKRLKLRLDCRRPAYWHGS